MNARMDVESSVVQDAQNAFRIVILEPADHTTDPICCHILNTTLNSHEAYEALSYVWGTIMADEPINLKVPGGDATTEASRHYITQNLEDALRSLRQCDKPRTLWVDAICINQNDTKERNEQVKLMGRIYSQCARDLLWLGSDADKIGRGMHLVKSLADHTVQLANFTDEDWSDVAAMLGRNSVWNRTWIVQELYFAPEILLFCPGRSQDWNVLISVMEDNAEWKNNWLDGHRTELSRQIHEAFRNITTFQVIRHERIHRSGVIETRLMALVQMFGRWDATLPIDKIYGLLNVAKDAGKFPIDYNKHLDEVSLDLAHHVISSGLSLSILSAALGIPCAHRDEDESSSTQSGLPSWVLDISKSIPSTSGLTQNGHSCYKACGRWGTPSYSFSDDRRHLTLKGWTLDCVKILKEVSPSLDGETDRDRWVRDVRTWAPENGETQVYGPTGESFLDAYWATITTDRVRDQRIKRDDDRIRTHQSLEERSVPEELISLPDWRFGYGTSGVFCMLPPTAEKGDLMALFFGAEVPFLLRPIGGIDFGVYTLVGEAYVHGYMDGQYSRLVMFGGRLDMLENPDVYTIV